MLRPPSAHCLDRLLAARDWSDRDLDRALADVGVLPPADLGPIRGVLRELGVTLATRRNADGHAIVEVRFNGAPRTLIHPDGRIEHAVPAAA